MITRKLTREEVESENSKIEDINEQDIDIPIPEPTHEKSSSSKSRKWTSRQISQKIIQFAEVLSGTTLFPYQKNFAFRLCCSVIDNDGEVLTTLFSRQMGKTEAISCIVAALMVLLPRLGNLPNAKHFLPSSMFDEHGKYLYRDGFWVGIFAPSKEQANTTYTRIRNRLTHQEALEILQGPDFRYSVDVCNGNTTMLSNGSLATCHTASPTANIESKTYHLIIAEECQDISDYKLNKSIAPMAAATNGTKVFIGTPNNRKCAFYFQIQENKRIESNGGVKNHFEYDYLVGAKYNQRYAKYVHKERTRLGFDSDEFKMAYRLIWILERGMFITEEELLGDADRGIFNKAAKDYELISVPKPGRIYVGGLDVAKENDSTVLTILDVDYDNPVLIEESVSLSGDIVCYKQYKKQIAFWMELQGNWETQYETIKEVIERFGLYSLYIDSTGVGDPLSDRLIANLPDVLVVPYKFSIPSKSVMWKNLSQEFAAGRIEFPYGEKARKRSVVKRFIQQMCDLEKRYSGQYMICEHPAERGAHDDYPDSLGLACLAAKEEGMPDLEVTDNDFLY